MSQYINPVGMVPEKGRRIYGYEYAEAAKQIHDGETLVMLLDRLIFKQAVVIPNAKEWADFYGVYASGNAITVDLYALADSDVAASSPYLQGGNTMDIPDTIDGHSETYAVETDGFMGVFLPIHFAIRKPEGEYARIGEVYGSDGDVTASLWEPTAEHPGYKATFTDAADAAQWVVNEYERRTAESDWR